MQFISSPSLIMGYRGGDQDTVLRIVTGADDAMLKRRDYGWLGPGIYFWENDQQKAREWATGKAKRTTPGQITPFVLGAVVDLGNCLDLTNSENMELLSLAFEDMKAGGKSLPQNKSVVYGTKDRTLRYLNCAVIRHLHSLVREMGKKPFDTVRGMFISEKDEDVYTDSPVERKIRAHTQVAVYNPNCIKGFFLPRSTEA